MSAGSGPGSRVPLSRGSGGRPSAESGSDGAQRPPDLRLAGLAVAVWLTALSGLHTNLGVMAVAAVVAAVAAATVSGCLLRPASGSGSGRGASRWTRPVLPTYGWAVVAVLLGVVCGAAATGARLVVRDAPPLARLVHGDARVEAELVIRDDPRAIAGATGRPSTYLIATELAWLRPTATGAERVETPARILVLGTDPGWRQLLPGQRVRVTGRLTATRGGDLTAGVLSVSGPPEPDGRPSWAQRAAGRLRAGLQRACGPLPDEPGGLLPGLVVGDTSQLSPAVNDEFRTTGMTHLTAVSGSNVAIIIGLVLLLARWARAGPWLAAALCGIGLVGFVILARPSPSVVRAAAMGAVALLALATGRPRAALPALGATVAGLVLFDPDLAGDPGFALSVLATGGLLLLAPGWRDGLRRRGVPAGLAEALAVPAAAQLACTPVIAGLSGAISLVAVPANLLAAPAIAPATVLGVMAAVLSPVTPSGAEFAAWLAGWPARWLVAVARYGAELPAGTLPWPGGAGGALLLAALTVALLVAARRPVARRLVAVVTVSVVVGALPVRLIVTGWPPAGWIVLACAVGQGDAIVLSVAPGQAVVVDAGPEPVAVDRCLRQLGVRLVPLLVLTHFHADHVGGIAGVFRGRRVAAVVAPQWSEPAVGVNSVMAVATAAGTPVARVVAGWTYRAGSLELALIGPPYPLRGTRSDPNNNSLVLRARTGGLRILLAGDAETEEQRGLLEVVPAADLRADVLKVAHHGSAYQDADFLRAVAPSVALVSVGLDNGYGHPSAPVLAMLSRGGARVLRTDTDGDLAVLTGLRGPAVTVHGAPAVAGRR